MTRINRPDTLLTELRDIRRRLHALETAQHATAATARPADAPRSPAEEPTGTGTSDSDSASESGADSGADSGSQ
ncbi:hypothetical protein QFZ75_005168 [Streptomyces sp. V3I8]|uniref:hypothetical protein n=1 Tax=Streptomyces sp. V3I8 TaxID=3042279 RepID=UPI002784C157|nr:hypothetical protein [Streptomyces sp. V3I8]MDQ1038752.1 hypothetical protein [Streptomyces sp. V3I8]